MFIHSFRQLEDISRNTDDEYGVDETDTIFVPGDIHSESKEAVPSQVVAIELVRMMNVVTDCQLQVIIFFDSLTD